MGVDVTTHQHHSGSIKVAFVIPQIEWSWHRLPKISHKKTSARDPESWYDLANFTGFNSGSFPQKKPSSPRKIIQVGPFYQIISQLDPGHRPGLELLHLGQCHLPSYQLSGDLPLLGGSMDLWILMVESCRIHMESMGEIPEAMVVWLGKYGKIIEVNGELSSQPRLIRSLKPIWD